MEKVLKNSWAYGFFENVFSVINEERFSVLYKEGYSRPNAPVNLLVSLLIIKEIDRLADEQLIESLCFDFRFHYALGIDDIEKERICINTLTNFRKRLVEYEEKTGVSLLEEEVKALSYALADKCKINTSLARMDSLMISSNCKILSRIDLVFTLIRDAVKELIKIDAKLISEDYKLFLENNFEKETLYRITSQDAATKLEALAEKAFEFNTLINHNVLGAENYSAFVNLKRFIAEQCIATETGNISLIKGKDVKANYLQTGKDPDATFRNKNGKNHIGYIGNVVECRDQEKEVSMILDFSVESNIHSDVSFAKEVLENKELTNRIDILCVDGGYYSEDIVIKAEEKNITVNFSQMTGTKPTEDKLYLVK